MSAVDLSAAAAHLRQEGDERVMPSFRRADLFDAVAGLLEAIDEWHKHGYQGYATENELVDAAGAVAAVVVPTTEEKP